MNCRCGSVLVSVNHGTYREWTCPLSSQDLGTVEGKQVHLLGPHVQPFLDRRVAVIQKPQPLDPCEAGWITRLIVRAENKPGPVGEPGSRSKRQPWHRGRRSLRKGTLADWNKRHNPQQRRFYKPGGRSFMPAFDRRGLLELFDGSSDKRRRRNRWES